MSSIINGIPSVLLGLIMVSSAVLIAGAAVVLVRRRYPNLQHSGREMIFMELVGIVYAVLLVFVVIAVWEQYEEARKTSEEEGAMLDSMWHIALAYPAEDGARIVSAIAAYAEAVTDDEWKTLANRQESPLAGAAIEEMRQAHYQLDLPSTTRFSNLYFHSIERLEKVTEHRLHRFIQSGTSVPGVVWTILILGGVGLVGLSVIVQEKSIPLHALMTATMAAMVAATLFIILLLDNPWAGDTALKPEAFEHIHTMQTRMHPETVQR